MPYPSKNVSVYSAPSKSSSTASNATQAGQNFLMIDALYLLLIDTEDKLLLEPLTMDWSYQNKN